MFENIRSLTEDGTAIGKQYWENFQLSHGRDEKEIQSIWNALILSIFL
jgi:hypothetical protein